mgnify:CR=1 FL=1|tara:strand:+ start:1464 stop:1733 length:270 start_codon:yes stop_codon:yes gene_type:complete
MNFSETHEFKNFIDDWQKMKWWKGRLVKAKYEIKSLFEPSIPKDTVGIVLNIYKSEAFGDALEIYWVNNYKSLHISKHDIYSGEGKDEI